MNVEYIDHLDWLQYWTTNKGPNMKLEKKIVFPVIGATVITLQGHIFVNSK